MGLILVSECLEMDGSLGGDLILGTRNDRRGENPEPWTSNGPKIKRKNNTKDEISLMFMFVMMIDSKKMSKNRILEKILKMTLWHT